MPRSGILVIDDERSVTEALSLVLTELGHVVDSAKSGAEAKELLKGSPYDLVFTDLRLPRDLTREKLITALEGLYEYNTGVTPSITFGPNRRVGAMGAYVLSIDPVKKEFVSRGWVNN